VQQVSRFARHFQQSPESLGPEEIRAYQLHLTNDRKLAVSSVLIAVAALRFLYTVTLKKTWSVEDIIPAPKKPQRLPIVLSPEEVLQFLECVPGPKHGAILTTCYAAGLRISEVLHLRGVKTGFWGRPRQQTHAAESRRHHDKQNLSTAAPLREGQDNAARTDCGSRDVATTGTTAAAAGMKVSRLDHVSLQVSDLQRSREFYSNVFAVSVNTNPRPANEVRLDLGENALLVLRRAGAPGQVNHLGVKVEGFDKAAVTRQLRASGISPIDEPNVPGTPGFHVVDPDGFKVQLL
jgi:catechol 2,3-dioxygenase-like lactoylglutathione lyase family enzyme